MKLENKVFINGNYFTPRQVEIMKLLCTTKNYEEIAETLCVAVTTLKTHIDKIRMKLLRQYDVVEIKRHHIVLFYVKYVLGFDILKETEE